MQKVRMLLIGFAVIFSSFKLSSPTNSKLQWLTINDVQVKLNEQSKPVLIDLYTDWCHWCKVMDKKTYSNEKVISYLQEKFYVAKINAESKGNFTWKNKTYAYNQPYKINDFALYLSNGQASFPTTVIIPDDGSPPIPIAGFIDPKEMEPILKFFRRRVHIRRKTIRSFRRLLNQHGNRLIKILYVLVILPGIQLGFS